MPRLIERDERSENVLFPERLQDWRDADNLARDIDFFIDEFSLGGLGFEGSLRVVTGRPSYHSGTLPNSYAMVT